MQAGGEAKIAPGGFFIGGEGTQGALFCRDLIMMKKAAERPKDKEDLKALLSLKKLKNPSH